jgi:Flp pilus assembly protein TadG
MTEYNHRAARSRRGTAIIEFTLSSVVLIPLLLGVFVYGFRLIRSLQMVQVTRDLGHMYIRGINFRNAGPIQNAQTLASGFNLTATGTSVVVFSKVKVIQQADCDAANAIAPNVLPPGNTCVNLNLPVFMEQLTIGNTSDGSSAWGAPTPLQADFTVSVRDLGRTTTEQATGFGNVITLKAGEIAYVAEMVNTTPDLNIVGFSGRPQVYARSIY